MIPPASLARSSRGLRLDASGTSFKAIRTSPTSEQAQGSSRALYWDRHIIVHNKESGRHCQNYGIAAAGPEKLSPARPHLGPVLQDIQDRFHLAELPYQVHRLDKNTTGALLLARTSQRAKELARDFRQHKIHKTYHALVLNGENPLAQGDHGEATLWHHLDADNRPHSVSAGTKGAREAKTQWRVLGLSEHSQVALLELKPTTGFKHQLRLACAHKLGRPILGDLLHGRLHPLTTESYPLSHDDTSRGASESNPAAHDYKGMFLHASRLSVTRFRRTGPSKRLQLTIGAPLPPEWIAFCNFLGIELPPELVEGGVWVDGQRVADGRVPELDGEWIW
ncbi:unnamed protein product [Peniophora sp. CBMAI 1063]|nr:unnamed protein product [Peniophora sp. CBMAI 1063]